MIGLMAMPLKSFTCERFSASVLDFWDGYYVAMIKTVRDAATKNYQLISFSYTALTIVYSLYTSMIHNRRVRFFETRCMYK